MEPIRPVGVASCSIDRPSLAPVPAHKSGGRHFLLVYFELMYREILSILITLMRVYCERLYILQFDQVLAT